jgi:hypothetical protein
MGLSVHSTQIVQGMSDAEPCQHKHGDLLFVTECQKRKWVRSALR